MTDPNRALLLQAGDEENKAKDVIGSGGHGAEPGGAGFPCVTDLVAAQAERAPQRTAIEWSGGEAWSYSRVVRKADGIARELLKRGVAHGELVGVCVPRRPEMLAGVLGVMRAGAAYVALDPAFPSERLRYMIEHAGIQRVLVWRTSDIPEPLRDICQLIVLENLPSEPASGADLPTLSGDDLAYVLYTSGSTGLPKGVRILHRNLTNFLQSMRREPGIAADDVLCAVTTLSFDIAALELFLPLLVGARVVIAKEDEQVDPRAFAAILRKHAVTILQTTPTLLRLLVGSNRSHDVRGIKLLIGGEPLPRDLAESTLRECRELWNLYGPTETTIWSTLHRVHPGKGDVPLGKPVANTSIHVLDSTLKPCAEGDIGEIWIGGDGVADGYLKDPDKTAERFLRDPFAADGSRMYRTGDLGSLCNGMLYFHGRADDQIKLRGYRIEPGDVEAAALAEPGISQAVAVARQIDNGDRRLILYIVAEPPDPTLLPRLRVSLRDQLPAYMLPHHIDVLDALPRTPNGKIDRQALPLPKSLSNAGRAPKQDVADRLEPTLAAVWRELLKVDSIGLHDDFFDLGGDSLLAVRAFERMQALTGVNLPLATLLTAPTIAAQAAAFRAAGARDHEMLASIEPGDNWAPLVPIQPHGSRHPLFFVHAIGGNVLNYVSLGRQLGEDQPVYGIQARGLDGITPPSDSLPSMARMYIREIRRQQPAGPYFLAGGSMGGMIAFEIAQQLRAAGEPIGLLAMMDTHGPHHEDGDGGPRLGPLQIARALLARLRRLPDARRIQRARAAGRPLPHALRHREIERVHHCALRAYRPAPYGGRILLFRASKRRAGKTRALGWSGFATGGLEIIDLSCDHDHLIEQPELSGLLRAALERGRMQQTD